MLSLYDLFRLSERSGSFDDCPLLLLSIWNPPPNWAEATTLVELRPLLGESLLSTVSPFSPIFFSFFLYFFSFLLLPDSKSVLLDILGDNVDSEKSGCWELNSFSVMTRPILEHRIGYRPNMKKLHVRLRMIVHRMKKFGEISYWPNTGLPK